MKKLFKPLLSPLQKLFVFLFLISIPLVFSPNVSQAQAETETKNSATVNTYSLNVRSSPGMGSNIVGVLRQGDQVQVVTEDFNNGSGWCRIDYSYNGGQAYVACRYLNLTQQLPDSGGPMEGTMMTVVPAALNVRSQPWMGNNIIGHVNRGETVNVISSQNGWCRIDFNGREAYVACNYLSSSGTGTGADIGGPIPGGTMMTVTPAALNVRSTPSMGNNIIGHVNRGETVNVLSGFADNGWCRIDFNGREAYVACNYLSPSGTGTGADIGGPIPGGTMMTVTPAALNVRSQPWMGNNIIGHVNRGETVNVLSSQGGWCRIDFNGREAYVACSYLTR